MSRTQRTRRAATHATRVAEKRTAREAAKAAHVEQARLRAQLEHAGAITALASVAERLGVTDPDLAVKFAEAALAEPPSNATGFWVADIVHTVLDVRDRLMAVPGTCPQCGHPDPANRNPDPDHDLNHDPEGDPA